MSGLPASEAEAYELLERLRWGGAPSSCPLCEASGRCYFLRPSHGSSRATRTGAATERRVWKCGACRRQFSVLAGTVLQGTRISLRAWIAVVADSAVARRAPTASYLADKYGLSRSAARHMTRRVELAFRYEPVRSALVGSVS
jgi:transposase-like protein